MRCFDLKPVSQNDDASSFEFRLASFAYSDVFSINHHILHLIFPIFMYSHINFNVITRSCINVIFLICSTIIYFLDGTMFRILDESEIHESLHAADAGIHGFGSFGHIWSRRLHAAAA